MDEVDTEKTLYQELLVILQNELELTDLLPCQPDIINPMMEQINHMSNVITNTKNKWTPFCLEQHQVELERITYLVNNYLRTRLKKIEANAPYLIKMIRTDPDRTNKYLSAGEQKYLDNYNLSINDYMMDVVLQPMPETMRRFRLSNMESDHDSRSCKTYVFVMGKTEANIMDGDNEINLEPDVCKVLSVATVLDLLEKKSDQFSLI